jgi:hypothetical protein
MTGKRGAVLVSAYIGLCAVGLSGQATEADPLLLKTKVDLSYEYHLRSADVLVEGSDVQYKNGIDLMRDVLAPPPFAAIDWELGRRSGLAIGFAAELRKQFPGNSYSDMFAPDNFLNLGRPGNPVAFEKPMITKGALYWRSESLDIIFGRDKVDLDEGLKGSLYPSPRLPYLDAFQAKGRLGRLGMNWVVGTIRATGSWEGPAFDVDPNIVLNPSQYDHLLYDRNSITNPYGFQGDPNPTTIIEALHRFTWDFGQVQLGVAGHVVYARRNNRFLITDFLPVISWHQTTVMSNNMSLLADISWEPFEGLRVAAMGGLDEINAKSIGINDSGSPTVPAGVLGARYRGSLGAGAFDLYGEVGYTHWLWGNYDGSNDSPGDVDPLARAQYRLHMDAGDGLLPLTSPYGPGATWGELHGSWKPEGGTLTFGLDLLVLSKIKAANLITTDPLSPLSDASTFLFIEAGFPVSFQLGPFELYARPALVTKDGSWSAEATLGAAYHLRRASPVGAAK